MTIPIYPGIVKENDLSPDQGFGSEIDDLCQQIRDATKGWGANKQKVIDAIATQNITTRCKMAIRYKELFERELVDVMKKEFSGDFGVALEFLSLPSDKAECAMIRKACKGIGAQVNVVWSIVCGRTNEEMDRLKKTYFTMYNKDLGKLLASELHGDMERLVFNCLQGAEDVYDPQFHTAEKAIEEAEEIHSKGQGRWGTDGRGIFKLLCKAPPEHIENMNKAYADKYGFTLMKAMEKEMGGNVKEGTIFMLGMKQKPYETIGDLIRSACVGFGTDELLLTTLLIRYQPIMSEVMSAHIEKHGKTIHDRVRSEVGGKFKDLLLQVLNTAWPEQG
ncbi:annexin [Phaeodactylum tricornutum CCAP 1055/1]|jgi:hypothetical protein|uniref:Annexin n=1 Tax=Phaeodactylum tricornutum (strain CCAP 1055/1) TaxID=556484 RepID=B5Y5D2_PHATC|nr:annexin [Phaeodactylum tricornutum CCAP 1055/1]ACI65915.1 annexin [Phaeodactylum tricornutum CCAP 1055/1]|eukprot:XP_002186445.1 annexin [Phaeodactylum tricornutum CCAP 1055/1]